jgi:hypothetical protein
MRIKLSSFARFALVLALSIVPLAACGDKAEPADAKGAATASADTSALGTARRQLGAEVRQAIPYTVRGKAGRFIAAALPVREPVADPLRQGVSVAPGGHEIVILEMSDTSIAHAFTKPGLYVTGVPGAPGGEPGGEPGGPMVPDTGALRHLTGVDDMNGDGDAEVWSVQYGGPRHPYTWEIRAYDRGGRALYQLAGTRRSGGTGIDPRSWDPSGNLQGQPAVRDWMARKVEALEARFAAADTPAGSGR